MQEKYIIKCNRTEIFFVNRVFSLTDLRYVGILGGIILTCITILGFRLYDIFYYLFISSVLGWMMETTLVSYKSRQFVNRGFLNGFYCPIYGVGICCVILLFSSIKDNLILLFLGGFFLTSILEYFTSWVMETLFHARWWDYSQFRWNINGRICLSISLAWGILIVVTVRFVHSFFAQLVHSIPLPFGEILATILLIAFFVDLFISLYGASKFSSKLKYLTEIRKEFVALVEQSKFYEEFDEIKTKVMSERFVQITAKITQNIREKLSATGVNGMHVIFKAIDGITEKYDKSTEKISMMEKRFLKAYPNLISSKAANIVNDIRDTIHKSKNAKKGE